MEIGVIPIEQIVSVVNLEDQQERLLNIVSNKVRKSEEYDNRNELIELDIKLQKEGSKSVS
ncbi:hypothetical protein ABEW32_12395 [Paenibacillus jamilae]|uniref:hypothetical protein n=1 Tax=Paenibacillus jamilae TaxID=114136 RepID=UPI003D26AD57